jgi:hypothetical protein
MDPCSYTAYITTLDWSIHSFPFQVPTHLSIRSELWTPTFSPLLPTTTLPLFTLSNDSGDTGSATNAVLPRPRLSSSAYVEVVYVILLVLPS